MTVLKNWKYPFLQNTPQKEPHRRELSLNTWLFWETPYFSTNKNVVKTGLESIADAIGPRAGAAQTKTSHKESCLNIWIKMFISWDKKEKN